MSRCVLTSALQTEIDTPEMKEKISAAFKSTAIGEDIDFEVFYEHGQHWITALESGAQWSVVDVEGPSAVDGFGFELVTEGREE